ncbi:MAG: hypothetical protein JW904_01960 [Spirochaetales bacterium]|nr:hypothetical protein [Spirochaetales bacterium]
MKKTVFVLLVLTFFTSHAFSQDGFNFSFENAPMELSVNVFAEIDFSTFPPPFGPMGEFVVLPISIAGTGNRLGFGAQAGVYFLIGDEFYAVPAIAGIFVGRFALSPEWIIDWDARLGVMIGGGAVLYGASIISLRLNAPWKSRVLLGIEFTGNPYYSPGDPTSSELIYGLVIGYGVYIF